MNNKITFIYGWIVLLLFSCSNDDVSTASQVEETFTVIEFSSVPITKTYNTPVFVHYMPWFETPEFAEYPKNNGWGLHWTMETKNPETILSNGRRDIASHYYPMIEPYDNGEPDYCEYASVLIKLSGIDGVIFDTPINSPMYDHPLMHDHTEALIPYLKKAGLKYMFCYEDNSLKFALDNGVISDMVERGKEVMQYTNDKYFSDASYFRLNNKPVFLNFGPQAILSDTDWNTIFADIQPINFLPLAYHGNYYNLNTSANGAYAWVGESLNENFYNYAQQFSVVGGGALFEYREYHELGGWTPSTQGHITPENGSTFTQSLNRAKNANVDFIQLITWNDWGEGTAIEPSLDYGFHQLTIVQEFVGMQPNPNDLELAVQLYKKRKEHKGKDLENKKLDQVFYYLISLQLDKARNLLNQL